MGRKTATGNNYRGYNENKANRQNQLLQKRDDDFRKHTTKKVHWNIEQGETMGELKNSLRHATCN